MMQASFMCILKISAIKSIKSSITTAEAITQDDKINSLNQ